MTDLDLAINYGTVINADGRKQMHVGVRDERVVVLSESPLKAEHVIDANGKWVLPGVIDPHVHFALKQGEGEDATETEDDFESGPKAAAVGGVTTFIAYAIAPRSRSPLSYLKERMSMAEEGSCIDYSFHGGVTNPDPEVLEEFPEIVEMGVPSIKFFVTYRKWGFAVNLGFLMEAMRTLKELNGVACLHAEHDEILEFLRSKHANKEELIYHSRTRPDYSEEISVQDAIILARETGARLYIVHLTTEKALDRIRVAQQQGVQVKTETCPHYLAFTDQVYEEERGVLYTMTPPLRPPGNREALWRGLQDGAVSVVSSDHNALSAALKRKAPHWLDVAPGLAGTEMVLTYLHSEGVVNGPLQAEDMVRLVAYHPAKIFGLPGKGKVDVGCDADFVIFDPEKTRTVHHEELATPIDFSIYEGMDMTGWPTHTISHGEVIVKDRQFLAEPGRGRFIERHIERGTVW